jgi:hypothetical protein
MATPEASLPMNDLTIHFATDAARSVAVIGSFAFENESSKCDSRDAREIARLEPR